MENVSLFQIEIIFQNIMVLFSFILNSWALSHVSLSPYDSFVFSCPSLFTNM